MNNCHGWVMGRQDLMKRSHFGGFGVVGRKLGLGLGFGIGIGIGGGGSGGRGSGGAR